MGDKRKMNEEHTLSLEELGEIKTVKVYNQAYVDKQQKCIETLEKENAELKKEVEKHKWNDIFLEDCAIYDKKIAEEYTTSQERIAKLEKACHKWFMRWREAKKDALYFDSSLQKQIEATYKVVEELNKAKTHIHRLLVLLTEGKRSYAIIDEARAFIKE